MSEDATGQGPSSFVISCPGCGDEIVIDAKTGAVLDHSPTAKPPAGGRGFDELMDDLESQKDKAEQLFDQERAALEDRDRLLEEKFRKALERVDDEDDDKPPERPFDFD